MQHCCYKAAFVYKIGLTKKQEKLWKIKGNSFLLIHLKILTQTQESV